MDTRFADNVAIWCYTHCLFEFPLVTRILFVDDLNPCPYIFVMFYPYMSCQIWRGEFMITMASSYFLNRTSNVLLVSLINMFRHSHGTHRCSYLNWSCFSAEHISKAVLMPPILIFFKLSNQAKSLFLRALLLPLLCFGSAQLTDRTVIAYSLIRYYHELNE